MSSATAPRDRRTGDVRIVWVRARAHNVARRPMLVASLATAAFIAALLMLLLVPREAGRAAQRVAPRPEEVPDTAATLARIERERGRIAVAESSLARAAELAARPAPAPLADSMPPALAARRDSLAAGATSLGALVARAQTAPLFATWRELGDAPAMRDDPRVKALLDSLTSIERDREAFGAVGGVDPIFVALTNRATAIGRTLQGIADDKIAGMRRGIESLRVAAPPPPPAPIRVDTMPIVARRDSATLDLDAAIRELQGQRRTAAELELRSERARELANVHAPPVAMLGAALVIGIALGFALALGLELRRPRIADAREAERVTGARVFSIGLHTPPPERSRRRSDRLAPPLIDTSGQRYRLPYLHLAAAGSRLSMVAVTGPEPDIVAVAAANLAAVATQEARSALLVDSDPAHGTVAGVARVRPTPGFAEVVAGEAAWADALATTLVGRERVLEVIPGGRGRSADAISDGELAALRQALVRLARRYDFAVFAAPLRLAGRGTAGILPASDVVLCARVAHTGVGELRTAARTLRDAGLTLRAVMLWEGEVPRIPTADELAAALRLAAQSAFAEAGIAEPARR